MGLVKGFDKISKEADQYKSDLDWQQSVKAQCLAENTKPDMSLASFKIPVEMFSKMPYACNSTVSMK